MASFSGKQRRKTGGRDFKPGQSGNPTGRPKIPTEVIEMARAMSPDAIVALGRVMRSSRSPAAAIVSAATAILDRAYGKPTQPVAAKVSIYERMSLDERIALDLSIAAALAVAGDAAGDPGGQPPTHH